MKTNSRPSMDLLKKKQGDLWFEASQIAWKASMVERNNANQLKVAYEMMHEAMEIEHKLEHQ